MPILLPSVTTSKASGSPEIAVLGTNTSIPGGLEAFFKYDDLTFNVRDNIDTYLLTDIDGLQDADVRDQREPLPQAHGEAAYNSFYGGKTITFTGKIRAYSLSKLRDMQEAMRMAFSELEEKPLTISSNFSEETVWINCRKNAPISMRESQVGHLFTRDFLITLRASDPRFRSVLRPNVNWAPSGSSFPSKSVYNNGNFKAQPTIELTGPMINPTVTNVTNGESLTLVATISVGQKYIIDTQKGTLKTDTGDNKFSTLDTSSDWITVDPGENIFTISATGIVAVSSFANIIYYHTWI